MAHPVLDIIKETTFVLPAYGDSRTNQRQSWTNWPWSGCLEWLACHSPQRRLFSVSSFCSRPLEQRQILPERPAERRREMIPWRCSGCSDNGKSNDTISSCMPGFYVKNQSSLSQKKLSCIQGSNTATVSKKKKIVPDAMKSPTEQNAILEPQNTGIAVSWGPKMVNGLVRSYLLINSLIIISGLVIYS